MKKLIFLLFLISTAFAQQGNKVQYSAEYAIQVHPNTSRVTMVCLIPAEIPNIQHVDSLQFSIKPDRIYEQNGDRLAEFKIKDIQGDFKIKVTAFMELFSNDLRNPKNLATEEDLSAYLAAENYLEVDNNTLILKAKSLKGKSDYQTLANIYNYVRKNLTYSGDNPADVGAWGAYQAKHGDCTEFADLFTTFCRINAIPARVIEGYKTMNITNPKHNWVEVYLPDLGWRVIDPTMKTFEKLDNAYVKLSSTRNNPNVSYYHYMCFEFWGGPIDFKEIIQTKNNHK